MKRKREFWAGHVERWRASGLTQAAYSRRLDEEHFGAPGIYAEAAEGVWSAAGRGRARLRSRSRRGRSPIELVG